MKGFVDAKVYVENQGIITTNVGVENGKIESKNTELIKENKERIYAFIKAQNTTVKNVEVLTVDGNGRAYFKTKKQPFKILTYTLSEEAKW